MKHPFGEAGTYLKHAQDRTCKITEKVRVHCVTKMEKATEEVVTDDATEEATEAQDTTEQAATDTPTEPSTAADEGTEGEAADAPSSTAAPSSMQRGLEGYSL